MLTQLNTEWGGLWSSEQTEGRGYCIWMGVICDGDKRILSLCASCPFVITHCSVTFVGMHLLAACTKDRQQEGGTEAARRAVLRLLQGALEQEADGHSPASVGESDNAAHTVRAFCCTAR